MIGKLRIYISNDRKGDSQMHKTQQYINIDESQAKQ